MFKILIFVILENICVQKLSCRAIATKKALLRGLKLLALGLFLQGGFFHGIKELTFGVDIAKMRWMGILQVCMLYH